MVKTCFPHFQMTNGEIIGKKLAKLDMEVVACCSHMLRCGAFVDYYTLNGGHCPGMLRQGMRRSIHSGSCGPGSLTSDLPCGSSDVKNRVLEIQIEQMKTGTSSVPKAFRGMPQAKL